MEKIKKNYLCTTDIFVSTAHSKKIVSKYLNNLEKVFCKNSINKKNLKRLYKGKISASTFDRLN